MFGLFIGGLIGYLFGRFPGLLIGAVAGVLLTRYIKSRLWQKLRNVQTVSYTHLTLPTICSV